MKNVRIILILVSVLMAGRAWGDQTNFPEGTYDREALELMTPIKFTIHQSVPSPFLRTIFDAVREVNQAYRGKIFEIGNPSYAVKPEQEDGENIISVSAGWGPKSALHATRLTAFWDSEYIYEVDLVINGDHPLDEQHKKVLKASIKNQLLSLVGMQAQ